MDIDFAVLVSPLGCYSGHSADSYIQREAQSYHKDPRPILARAQRERLVRNILGSNRLTPMIRAAIESYIFAHCTVAQWHILTCERKDAAVKQFYAAVLSNAGARPETMASSTNGVTTP